MPKTNEEVEELLGEWAELLQVTGADAFRVRAYEKAARSIGGYSKDLRELDDKGILAIPNVGKSMAGRIREYLDKGTLHELEDLREMVPGGMRELLRIPGLGPKKAILVYDKLGVTSLAELAAAAEANKLQGIKGLGAKTEENLLRGIRNYREQEERILIDVAMDSAVRIIASLTETCTFDEIAYAGSLRRMRETIGDLDILVAAADAEPIMEAFTSMPRVAEVLAKGSTKTTIVTRRGLQVDLRVVPHEAWGAALIYFTGSKAHNIKIREIAVKKGR
jgi:DNA polymerase (family 10)